MLEIQGNRTLSGTWAEVWIDGEKIMELSKISLKVTANREDVQLGLSVDSKITGLKGEGSFEDGDNHTRKSRKVHEDHQQTAQHIKDGHNRHNLFRCMNQAPEPAADDGGHQNSQQDSGNSGRKRKGLLYHTGDGIGLDQGRSRILDE